VFGGTEVRPAVAPAASVTVVKPAPAAAQRRADQPEPETDEVIEMREPPPSTWFDNLDSGPAPLRKPPDKKPPG
jgi:hypothetical protein